MGHRRLALHRPAVHLHEGRHRRQGAARRRRPRRIDHPTAVDGQAEVLDRPEGVVDQQLAPGEVEGAEAGVVQVEVGHHQLGDQARAGQRPQVGVADPHLVNAVGVVRGEEAAVAVEAAAQVALQRVVALPVQAPVGVVGVAGDEEAAARLQLAVLLLLPRVGRQGRGGQAEGDLLAAEALSGERNKRQVFVSFCNFETFFCEAVF